MFIVKICFVVVVMEGATSETHTLMSFKTTSTQVPNFPEYIVVGVVDGHQIYQYDSKTRRAVPKQEWMSRVTEEDPQYWERNTQNDIGEEQVAKVNLEIVMQRLNQTEGLHIYQVMSGCEWDDETDEVRGYYQFAFDGEDFISLDWDTQTWVAAKSQAFASKLRWERAGIAAQVKNEVIHVCVQNLKNYLKHGESTLKRTVLPQLSILQKSSLSPVTCFATGFYPERAVLFWAKDGEELEEDPGEILPNNDGTFQSSVSLDVSSILPEDKHRYNCVFQLSGLRDDLVTNLEPSRILPGPERIRTSALIIIIAAVLSVLVLAAAVGIILYRRCHNNNVI